MAATVAVAAALIGWRNAACYVITVIVNIRPMYGLCSCGCKFPVIGSNLRSRYTDCSCTINDCGDRAMIFTVLTLYGQIKTAEQRTIIYSSTVTGTLAVDGWAVTFGTARRGLGGLRACPSPPRCTKCV